MAWTRGQTLQQGGSGAPAKPSAWGPPSHVQNFASAAASTASSVPSPRHTGQTPTSTFSKTSKGFSLNQSTTSSVSFAKKNAISESQEQSPDAQKITKLDKVQISGLALLKIIKHSSDSLPDTCAGTLLGLDVNKVLEVTNCFAHPSDLTSTSSKVGTTDEASQEYQMNMMRTLRDSYADNCCVGWYKSTTFNSFSTNELLEEQLSYQLELDQENVARCVMLIFDPVQSTKGDLYLKAYRIKPSFVTFYEQEQKVFDAQKKARVSAPPPNVTLAQFAQLAVTGKANAGLLDTEVFEELPVEIVNSNHAKLYFSQLKKLPSVKEKLREIKSTALDLSAREFLEQSLERIIEETERIEAEEGKMQYYERQVTRQAQQQQQWIQQRRTENKARKERGEFLLPEVDFLNPIFKPIPLPSKVEGALARSQLEVFCDNLNEYVAKSFPTLYLSQGLQNAKP